jgi:hypothetical protein
MSLLYENFVGTVWLFIIITHTHTTQHIHEKIKIVKTHETETKLYVPIICYACIFFTPSFMKS